MENIYRDIAARTGGNIYIGVIGPVRTGKSTLVKRIMEELVIPGIHDPYTQERAKDELPQSGSGRTIMTSEPKFVPEEAVEISPDGTAKLRIRMIDSVGYMVDGAMGATEDGVARMVSTPWCADPIPMAQAAELGTKKVMQEHCSVGFLVTTDGTITDLPRSAYEQAEEQSIRDMQATKKPFLTIVNSADPSGEAAKSVKKRLYERFGIEAVAADCQALDAEGIRLLLTELMYVFPMQQLHVHLPRWMDAVEPDHPVKAALYKALLQRAEEIGALAQAEVSLRKLNDLESVLDFSIQNIDLGTGTVVCRLGFPEKLFYEILSSKAGVQIQNDAQLLNLLAELSSAKRDYDRISDALSAAKATGYGIVMPDPAEMELQTPQVLRKNGAYGVKLKAEAPSIHMIRVDIDTEITPTVGDEKQSQDLVAYLCGEDPDKLWQSNIFGKTVNTLIQEGLTAKLIRTPEEVRGKFRSSLTRIVNEGATGLVCLIL